MTAAARNDREPSGPEREVEWMRLTAPELRDRAAANALVIVPVASLEQHGPHLATGTDIVLGTEVSHRTARRLAGAGQPVVVTPCVWTGLAEHHVAFGGTVSLDYAAFFAVLRGVVRSAKRAGFARVMLLNGHGGNAEAVALASSELSAEFGLRVAAGTYWHLTGEVIAPILERQPGLMHAERGDRRRARGHPGQGRGPARSDLGPDRGTDAEPRTVALNRFVTAPAGAPRPRPTARRR